LLLVICVCVRIDIVLCFVFLPLVCPVSLVSLNCSFLVVPSVFSNVYLLLSLVIITRLLFILVLCFRLRDWMCSSNEHGSSQMTYLEYFYYYFHRYRRPVLGTVLRPSPLLPMHVYDYYSPMAVLVQQRLCLPPEHFPEK